MKSFLQFWQVFVSLFMNLYYSLIRANKRIVLYIIQLLVDSKTRNTRGIEAPDQTMYPYPLRILNTDIGTGEMADEI